jgi:hypothetical protein
MDRNTAREAVENDSGKAIKPLNRELDRRRAKPDLAARSLK